jgi:hypothetical protein
MHTRDKVQQLYLATVVMNIQVPKKAKNILTQTGHHISYMTATFQPIYEGKHIIIYAIYKDKYTKEKMSPMCVSHVNHTSTHLA